MTQQFPFQTGLHRGSGALSLAAAFPDSFTFPSLPCLLSVDLFLPSYLVYHHEEKLKMRLYNVAYVF